VSVFEGFSENWRRLENRRKNLQKFISLRYALGFDRCNFLRKLDKI